MSERPKHILPIIVFSQFAGTSLWFASNVIIPDLANFHGFSTESLGLITMSVQAGFISGTLVFALLSIADRVSPSKIFLICSLIGALFNISLYHIDSGLPGVMALRFLTGFTLAGIYPIGMKIAADWYDKGLGKALGYLVGALVLGTAFPHFLGSFKAVLPWGTMLYTIAILSASGGLLLYFLVGDGPFRKPLTRFNYRIIFSLFDYKDFRASTLGYFGHMWELYTFWVFTPVLLSYYRNLNQLDFNISLWSFAVIGIGTLGCIVGGIISESHGNYRVAHTNLLGSGICILLFPLMVNTPIYIFMPYMLLWGWLVIGDSPQFSALSAKTAPKELIGSALTIMNSIGFTLTIFSIWIFEYMAAIFTVNWIVFILLPGPIIGLISIRKLNNRVI